MDLFAEPYVAAVGTAVCLVGANRAVQGIPYAGDLRFRCIWCRARDHHARPPNARGARGSRRAGETPRFTFEEQDYLVRSLRGNAVFRWEYRPGSTLFLVWQQQREGFEAVADLTAVRDVASVFGDRARNVFLVKMSYWMGR